MSLEAQEQVLFDLLFDRALRDRFLQSGISALSGRGLTDEECRDFSTIRPEALRLDAAMRTGFILSQFCRSYPLSFSLASSCPQGVEGLRQLVDVHVMRRASFERLLAFGLKLKEWFQRQEFSSARERSLVVSIVDAEIGMAWTSAAIKKTALQGAQKEGNTVLPEQWLLQRVKLSPFVSAAVLPSSYAVLKAALCEETGAGLWRRLSRQPLAAEARQQALAMNDPRVLVARAVVTQDSRCEPMADHRTVELSEGFASLLGHVDGTLSVAAMLQQLRQAGADEGLLGSVQEGFRQLGQQGMLSFEP
jgi:hypothetical protein